MLAFPLDSLTSQHSMRPGPLSFAGFGCAALAAGLGFLSSPAELTASSTGLTALADADGDLLDDALELRLGTDPNQADPDQDGRTDLEEHLLGSDPNVYEDPQSLPNGFTTFSMEVYQVGPDFVFEFYALVNDQVHSLEIYRGLLHEQVSFRWSEFAPWQVDSVRTSCNLSGWELQRARIRIDSSWIDQHPSVAFGAVAVVDQEVIADSVQLTHSGGYLAELDLRINEGNTRASTGNSSHLGATELFGGSGASTGGGGQKTGGLFPVDPGSGGSSSGTSDEICVQTLVPMANLGGGRVQYVVADADCDPEPGSVCMPGCVMTKDDVIVAIDVVGLLGG